MQAMYIPQALLAMGFYLLSELDTGVSMSYLHACKNLCLSLGQQHSPTYTMCLFLLITGHQRQQLSGGGGRESGGGGGRESGGGGGSGGVGDAPADRARLELLEELCRTDVDPLAYPHNSHLPFVVQMYKAWASVSLGIDMIKHNTHSHGTSAENQESGTLRDTRLIAYIKMLEKLDKELQELVMLYSSPRFGMLSLSSLPTTPTSGGFYGGGGGPESPPSESTFPLDVQVHLFLSLHALRAECYSLLGMPETAVKGAIKAYESCRDDLPRLLPHVCPMFDTILQILVDNKREAIGKQQHTHHTTPHTHSQHPSPPHYSKLSA